MHDEDNLTQPEDATRPSRSTGGRAVDDATGDRRAVGRVTAAQLG